MDKIVKRIFITIFCVGLICSGIEMDSKHFSAVKASDTTVIDVTDLFAGEAISHDCSLYLGTNYDTTNHWDECTICKKKYNIASHSYSTYWTMGSSCSLSNKLRHTCSCGYSYDTNNTRSHTDVRLTHNASTHYYACWACSNMLSAATTHTNSSGQYIGCRYGVSGVCSVCGNSINATYHNTWWSYDFNSGRGAITGCGGCGRTIYTGVTSSISRSGANFTLTLRLPVSSSYGSISHITYGSPRPGTNNVVITGSSYYLSGNTIVYTIIGYTANNDITNSSVNLGFSIYTSSGHYFATDGNFVFRPEIIPPVINDIQEEDLAVDGDWVTAKQLTISGTENYCGTVKLSMSDSNGNVYLDNVNVNVSNKNWSYTFIPEIEADEQGMTFTITAQDSLGNKSTKTVIYYNTDKKPPALVSNKETSKEWSRTKDITIDTTDFGARDVSIAFNDTDDYQLAKANENNFTRPYILTGDVYGSTVAAIYAKDGLGNTRTEFITIYNLDNTKPTITKATSERNSIRSAAVTVEANDINTRLNASGSGVVGYAITQDKTEPNENAFQSSNVFELTKSGTWYVWAIDAVGNISSPVPVDVKIEYTVSLNPNGGTLTGDSEYQIISGETITIPEPEREGYTFTGWTVNGEDSFVSGNEFTMGSEDADITANWQINQYEVNYIDEDVATGYQLGIKKEMIDYNTPVSGEDIGSSSADNAYYPNYKLVETTDSKVTINGATVYRYFEWLTRNVEGSISWIDNHNKYDTRPENIKIVLFQNGKPVDSVNGPLGGERVDTSPIILSTDGDKNDFGFYDLPVYDENGNPYVYEIRMFDVDAEIDFNTPSGIESMENPESKYVTTQNGFDISNMLQNTAQDKDNPDIPDDSNGFEVQGAIHWIDSGNKLGLRPHTVKISLLQDGEPFMRNGEPYEIIVDALNDNTYDFVRLPKYKYVDGEPVPYEYTAVETITSTYVKDGIILPLYDIHTDENNGDYEALHFTNYLHTDGPMIPVIPTDERDNEISIITNTKDAVDISLKMLDFYITGTPENIDVEYAGYNGNEYNVSVSEIGEVIKHIPSGKYEIAVNEAKYSLKNIYVSDNTDNVRIVYEDGKYYLVIEHVSGDSKGTINFDMEEKPCGFQTRTSLRNYFSVNYIAAMNLLENYSISELTEPVQAVMTEKYQADDTINTENEVIIVHPVLKEKEEETAESSEMLEENFDAQELEIPIEIELNKKDSSKEAVNMITVPENTVKNAE